MDAAIDTAVAELELRVIEASGVLADGAYPPVGGERDRHAQGVRGTAEYADAERSGAGRAVSGLTAAEALHFLTLHTRRRRETDG